MAGYIGSKAVLLSTTAAVVTGDADIGGDLTVDTNTLFVDAANNRVGVGTASPVTRLHSSVSYASPTGGHDGAVAAIVSNSGSADNYVGLELSGGNNGGSFVHFGDTDDANVGALAYFHNGNYMRFDVNASERMRIDPSGHLIVPAGVTLGTSAGVYNAANTLDDYEEGTFTPFLYGSSTAGSPTYSTRSGFYTKVGRLVTIGVQLVLSNKGGMSGEIRVGGIPFAASSTSQDREAGLVRLNTGITTTETYNVFPLNGETNCIFRSCNTATDKVIGDSQISDNTTFHFGLTYRTT